MPHSLAANVDWVPSHPFSTVFQKRKKKKSQITPTTVHCSYTRKGSHRPQAQRTIRALSPFTATFSIQHCRRATESTRRLFPKSPAIETSELGSCTPYCRANLKARLAWHVPWALSRQFCRHRADNSVAATNPNVRDRLFLFMHQGVGSYFYPSSATSAAPQRHAWDPLNQRQLPIPHAYLPPLPQSSCFLYPADAYTVHPSSTVLQPKRMVRGATPKSTIKYKT